MLKTDKETLFSIGWLLNSNKSNGNDIFNSPIKLQFYVFFYKLFMSLNNKHMDFNSLKILSHMVSFTDVWEDYFQKKESLVKGANEAFKELSENDVAVKKATNSLVLVSTLSVSELMDLAKSVEFNDSQSSFSLTEESKNILYNLSNLCEANQDIAMIHNIFWINNKGFLMNDYDVHEMTPEQMDVLYELSISDDLKEVFKPIYVSIANGRLILD